ncbi:MAG: DEAD/DEAH box helicase [Balneolaceae bacterium]|nr:DEAD/DEAH box helicase [Balneolaceae bacterium]
MIWRKFSPDTNGPIQKVMFSATVPHAIRDIMNRYMNNPETVTIEREGITAPNIDQYLVEVRDSVRTEAICRFMDINDFRLALVFCNTKRKTESLTNELIARGYASDYINGDLSQNQRDRVMNKFRKGQIDILVATDVAARGIDVDDIDAVFNYDVPQDPSIMCTVSVAQVEQAVQGWPSPLLHGVKTISCEPLSDRSKRSCSTWICPARQKFVNCVSQAIWSK